MYTVQLTLKLKENYGDWEIWEIERESDPETNFFKERKKLTHYYWGNKYKAIKAARLLKEYHALMGREYTIVYPKLEKVPGKSTRRMDPMFKEDYEESLLNLEEEF